MNNVDLLEVKLLVDKKIIIESLSRIGIANKKTKVLFPSCYLYEDNGRYYIAHFKQLFLLTRNDSYNNICKEDIIRRNAIAFCLKNWKLIDIEDEKIQPYNKMVFVLPFKEKKNWRISHKFNFKSINSK